MFPWIADLSGVKPIQEGALSSLDLSKIKFKNGFIVMEGFIRIEDEGTYQMSMAGNGSFLLRLHRSTVLDGSFKYNKGQKKAK